MNEAVFVKEQVPWPLWVSLVVAMGVVWRAAREMAMRRWGR
jgi:hypothetical protein